MMAEKNGRIELHQAWFWDCPNCGDENFCRSVTLELTDEDKEEIAELTRTMPFEHQTGDWISAPSDVTCRSCGKDFEVERDGDG